LLTVILSQHGNTQGYGLTALRCLMGYFSGLQEMMSHPDFIEMLFSLVNPQTVAQVCRQAIELLFVLCNFDGFALVHRAAKNNARVKGKEAYSDVIALLGSGDIETQVNALTLINSLLENAPLSKQTKLILRWRKLDVDAVLKRQSKIQHPQFKTQLALYETNSALVYVPTDKPGKGRRSYKELETLLEKYEEQQPLIRVLVQELLYYQSAIQVAIESGSFVNYRGPLARHDASDQGHYSPTGPVDLSFLSRRTGAQAAFKRSFAMPGVPMDDPRSPLSARQFSASMAYGTPSTTPGGMASYSASPGMTQ
jgi:hypothetical protein